MGTIEADLGNNPNGPTWNELMGSNNWEGLISPLNEHLRGLILRCGDLCQVTYDTFINDPNSTYCGSSRYSKAHLLQKTAYPEGSDRYEVVMYLYATSRVSVPQAFLLKSRSRERWDRESNWIGYVVVSNDEVSKQMGRREIYVAWRGTIRDYEWVDVLQPDLQSATPLLHDPFQEGFTNQGGEGDVVARESGERGSGVEGGEEASRVRGVATNNNNWGGVRRLKEKVGQFVATVASWIGLGNKEGEDTDNNDGTPKVMKGWLTVYLSDDPKSPFTKLSARQQLLTKLKQLIGQYKEENLSITFAGHSLGATLSVVSAFDVAQNLTNGTNITVSAIVFGCPKVGNKEFKKKFDEFSNLKVLHVKNVIDLIPHYPATLMGYANIGVDFEIDTRKSSFLKDSKNPSDWHNLQAMLHIVNGWQGFKEEFKVFFKRSIALVNKSCDYLKEECLVPPSWWVEKDKGMVLNEDGDWVLAPPEEMPIPEFE